MKTVSKPARDNRANQLNPNNSAYGKSRDHGNVPIAPAPATPASSQQPEPPTPPQLSTEE